MKKLAALAVIASLILVVFAAAQSEPRAEITGVNTAGYPQVILSANVFDELGLPQTGLTDADFRLESAAGGLAEVCQIAQVESISDDNLPFSTVLVIDVSDSMSGTPLQAARAAALAYVEGLRPGDSVAVVAFASAVRVVQPYTADQALLRQAIESLQIDGRTALYQAAYDAVMLTDSAPDARHAVILLSDGAEYGNLSRVTPEEVFSAAVSKGVPVYTIGLGFGADRSFLQNLSAATSAQAYETPTAEELGQIYVGLAQRLTSQVVLTLECSAPADGTEYAGQLVVNAPKGEISAPVSVRVPIPVPLVSLALPEGGVFSEPAEIGVEVRADDALTGAVITVGDAATELSEAPYALLLDPYTLLPGDYPVSAAVTDANGDVGQASASITIPDLPVLISADVLDDGTVLDGDTRIELSFSSQAAVSQVTVRIDGADLAQLTQAPFAFTIRPLTLSPGAHTLQIIASADNGGQGERSIAFSISDAPYLTATALAPTATSTPTATFTPSPTINATATALSALLTARPITLTANAILVETRAAEQAAVDAAATAAAASTQSAAATSNAAATVAAASTQSAAATSNALASATASADNAVSSATAQALETVLAATRQQLLLATRDALATSNAEARAQAQQTDAAQGTRDARAQAQQAATAAARETALALSNATGTALAESLATTTAQAAATAERERQQTQQASTRQAGETATAQAQVTAAALAQAATADARSTLEAFGQATATAEAQQTIDTRMAAIGTTTAEATLSASNTAVPTEALTPTAQPTLVPVEIEAQAADATGGLIAGVCVALALVLALVALVIVRRQRRSAPGTRPPR